MNKLTDPESTVASDASLPDKLKARFQCADEENSRECFLQPTASPYLIHNPPSRIEYQMKMIH